MIYRHGLFYSRYHVDRPCHDNLCLVVCLQLHAGEPVKQIQCTSRVRSRFIGIPSLIEPNNKARIAGPIDLISAVNLAFYMIEQPKLFLGFIIMTAGKRDGAGEFAQYW
jgi:hypothetical protein